MVSVFLGGLLPFAVVFAPVCWLLYKLSRRNRPAS